MTGGPQVDLGAGDDVLSVFQTDVGESRTVKGGTDLDLIVVSTERIGKHVGVNAGGDSNHVFSTGTDMVTE